MSLHIANRRSSRRAFSLVELSIVLVILGLLVGGVLSGQSLIRASELRAVGTEYSRYVTSVQTFRDKYFAIPGDMNNATAFWGHAGGTDCNNRSGTAATTPGTCDGDGNGNLANAAAASQTGEFAQLWRHLALAGLIEGTYSGNANTGGTQHCAIGTDCPRSKLSNAGWGANYNPNFAGDTYNYAFDYGNNFRIGSALATSIPGGAIFKPEEAWNIDTKLDDGRPGTGKIIPAGWDSCTTAATNADYTGTYDLANSAVVCALWFPKAY